MDDNQIVRDKGNNNSIDCVFHGKLILFQFIDVATPMLFFGVNKLKSIEL